MTERMRLPVWAAEMSFLLRVSGLTLRNRVQSLDIRERLGVGVEPLFLRIERSQLKWFGYLVRMPPGRLLVVGPTGKRPRGRNMTRWRNYYILDIGIISLGWPGNEEEVAREKDILVSLLSLLPPRPGPRFSGGKCHGESLSKLSLAALTSTEHYLESQPQRRRESSEFIDLFTVYYAAATQI